MNQGGSQPVGESLNVACQGISNINQHPPSPNMEVTNQLTQLEAARQLVLADSVLYPQIVQGILPIVGANARLELRRWGAEFLAETFASPTVSVQQKESLSIVVLQTLRELLEMPDGDTGMVKSVIQAAASIYGLVFRYT